MNEDKPVAKGEHTDADVDTVKERLATHPLGATTGAIGGAVTGAIGGMAAGPLGSLAGAAAGAVLGAALGSSTGTAVEPVDTRAHEDWWRENYATRPYIPPDANYDDYAAAFRYGTQAYLRSDRPRDWEEVEAELAAGWDAARGASRLSWDEARETVRDAWNRLHEPAG